jgi:hypothetical protein
MDQHWAPRRKSRAQLQGVYICGNGSYKALLFGLSSLVLCDMMSSSCIGTDIRHLCSYICLECDAKDASEGALSAHKNISKARFENLWK